jgi:Flp pilus assembly pilin Flp
MAATSSGLRDIPRTLHRPAAAPPLGAGQGLTEYALLITLVAVVVIMMLVTLGRGVKGVFCNLMITLEPEMPLSCVVPVAEEGGGDGDSDQGSLSALAGYRSSDQKLVVMARAPQGASATLTVAGYGTMSQVPGTDYYKLVVTTSDPPATVTIQSSEGGSYVVQVRGR